MLQFELKKGISGIEHQNQTTGPRDECQGKIKSNNGAELNAPAESGVLLEQEISFYMNRGFQVF